MRTTATRAWVAITAVSSRFVRRPTTRLLVGEFALDSGQWVNDPRELQVFRGRNTRPLALAANADAAVVLLPTRASIVQYVKSTATDEFVRSEILPPTRAARAPHANAYADGFGTWWLSDRRVYFRSQRLQALANGSAVYGSIARTGLVATGTITALVSLNNEHSALAIVMHSGALRLVDVTGTPTVLRAQTAHCPERCEWVSTQLVQGGFAAIFRSQIAREPSLSSYWLSRVSLDRVSAVRASSIPIVSGTALPIGDRFDAILQLSAPPIVRTIERPLAISTQVPYGAVPTIAAVHAFGERQSHVVVLDDRGTGVIAQLECSER